MRRTSTTDSPRSSPGRPAPRSSSFNFSAHPSRKILVVSLQRFLRTQFLRLRILGGLLAVVGLLVRPNGAGILQPLAVLLGAGAALVENRYRWAAFTSLDEMPGLLVARLGSGGFLAVPLTELPPATADQVTAFVRGHLTRPG